MDDVRDRKPRKGDIAFWSYDRFPYLLWGKIESVCARREDGRWVVRVENYGGGRFRIRYALPTKRGEETVERLEKLRWAHEERVRKANAESAQELKDQLRICALPVLDMYQGPMIERHVS